MVAAVEHIRGHDHDMLYGSHYDLGNRYIISISLMTTICCTVATMTWVIVT
jgi:hypothetical protein